MTKGLKIGFRKIFPIALVVAWVCTGLHLVSSHQEQLEQALMDKMATVTSTMASRGYSSEMSRSDLLNVLESSGLADYELSFIQRQSEGDGFIRVLSSDAHYGSDEPFRDTESWLRERFGDPGVENRTFEGNISKTISYAPVVEKGEVIGVYRLSSGSKSDGAFGWMALWPWLTGAMLFLFFLLTKSNPSNSNHRVISLDKKMELDTELRKKDSELKMLSLVAKKSQNLMLITDAKGIILWVNETYESRNNYSAEELNNFVGRHLPDVSKNIHIRTIIRNVVDFKKSVVYESESTGENGLVHYAMTTVTPVADEKGLVHKLLFVDTDITKLKRVEKENEVFKTLAERSNAPILRVDRQGVILFHNDASSRLLSDWCDVKGRLNERLSTLVQGVLDSCEVYSFEQVIDGQNLKVRFHPNCEDQTIHVLAEHSPLFGAIEGRSSASEDHLVG